MFLKACMRGCTWRVSSDDVKVGVVYGYCGAKLVGVGIVYGNVVDLGTACV